MVSKCDYKIALVLPKGPMRSSAISQAGAEHLGLGYIASNLRKNGYTVKIFNFQVDDFIRFEKNEDNQQELTNAEMTEEILSFNPKLVGISTTGITLENSLLISELIKKTSPEISICLGGHQASVTDEEIIENESSIDYVIKGEGEESFLQLAEGLRLGQSVQDIKGLCFRKEGAVHSNPMDSFIDLDTLPLAARDDLEYVKGNIDTREARISTSRGCLNACTFCIDPSLYRKRVWYCHGAKRVVDEMELLKNKYNINHFWVNDDNFIVRTPDSKQRAWDIGNEIINRDLGITYRVFFRSDVFPTGEDFGLLQHLYNSGLRIVLIGFESGSRTRLERFKKNTNVELNLKVAKLIKAHNLGMQIGFIMFDPFSTFDDLRKDIKFLDDIDEMYLIYNFIQNLDVFQGSEIARQLDSAGLLIQDVNYKTPYRIYKYADERVGKLAKAMENVFDTETIRRDKIIQRINVHEYPLLRDKLFSMDNHKIAEIAKKFEENKNEIIKEMNKSNYSFMLNTIELAEAGFDEVKFNGMRDKAVFRHSELYNKLVNEFNNLKSQI